VGASHPHTHLLYPQGSVSEEPRQTGLAASTGPIVFSGRLKPQRTILRGRGNPLSLSSPNAGRCRPRCPHPALFFLSPTVPLSGFPHNRIQRHAGSITPAASRWLSLPPKGGEGRGEGSILLHTNLSFMGSSATLALFHGWHRRPAGRNGTKPPVFQEQSSQNAPRHPLITERCEFDAEHCFITILFFG
jgi:hypothetical protein